MSKKLISKYKPVIILFMLGILAAGCSKKENDDPVFETGYSGLLEVTFTNSYPVWSSGTSLEVNISPSGKVVIDPGSLSYSGELITEDSKITRSGTWQMAPEGEVLNSGGATYITVDPGITVVNDVTTIYAKDNGGNWVQVAVVPYTGATAGDLSFSFEAATVDPGGAVVGVTEATGSIVWTLSLFPATSPL